MKKNNIILMCLFGLYLNASEQSKNNNLPLVKVGAVCFESLVSDTLSAIFSFLDDPKQIHKIRLISKFYYTQVPNLLNGFIQWQSQKYAREDSQLYIYNSEPRDPYSKLKSELYKAWYKNSYLPCIKKYVFSHPNISSVITGESGEYDIKTIILPNEKPYLYWEYRGLAISTGEKCEQVISDLIIQFNKIEEEPDHIILPNEVVWQIAHKFTTNFSNEFSNDQSNKFLTKLITKTILTIRHKEKLLPYLLYLFCEDDYNRPLIRDILEKFPYLINIKVDDKTILHHASAENQKEIVTLLLSFGANPNALNENRKTPLEVFINLIRSHPKRIYDSEIMQELLRYGARRTENFEKELSLAREEVGIFLKQVIL